MPQTVSYRVAKLVNILLAIRLANATLNLDPTGQGCVDPQGFLDCYEAQVNQAATCLATAQKTCTSSPTELAECVVGCAGYQRAGNIGCWLQSCWNQVYSCEYQGTAIEYLAGTDLVQSSVDIPFYPPPDNVPGACSCNLGYVWGNETFVWGTDDPCAKISLTGSSQELDDCFCCKNSLSVSNILNTCPNSNLTVVGFQKKLQETQYLDGNFTKDNCAILNNSSDICASAYGIHKAGSTWYNPLQLPSSEPGTEPLSNLPGIGLTEFGAASTTLKLFPEYSSVITPAPFNAQNAAPITGSALDSPITTGNATGIDTDTAIPTSTGLEVSGSTTSTTATGATTSKTGGVSILDVPSTLLSCVALAVVFSNLGLL